MVFIFASLYLNSLSLVLTLAATCSRHPYHIICLVFPCLSSLLFTLLFPFLHHFYCLSNLIACSLHTLPIHHLPSLSLPIIFTVYFFPSPSFLPFIPVYLFSSPSSPSFPFLLLSHHLHCLLFSVINLPTLHSLILVLFTLFPIIILPLLFSPSSLSIFFPSPFLLPFKPYYLYSSHSSHYHHSLSSPIIFTDYFSHHYPPCPSFLYTCPLHPLPISFLALPFPSSNLSSCSLPFIII